MTYDFSRSASRPAAFPLRTKRDLRSAPAKEIIGRPRPLRAKRRELWEVLRWGESSEC